MDAHTIKKALVNYRKNVDTIQKLNWRLEEMSTKLYEGGTSSVIKMPDGTPQDRSCVIIDFVAKEHNIQNEIMLLSKEVDIADEFIEKVDEFKDMIIDKYIIGLSSIDMTEKYCYTKASIKRKIDEQIHLYSD